MLTYDQLAHFADHGWVLVERVLDDRQCADYKAALDRSARTRRPLDPEKKPRVDLTYLDNLVLHDDLFLDWYRLPGILAANRQLLGAHLHMNHQHADIKFPHPDRNTRATDLADMDQMGWHRGLRPKWGTFPHDTDPRLINCTFINNITYLTAVSPGSGSTAVLDGSHKLEGHYQSLKSRCPVVQVCAPAGSILIFTESLVHTGTPILSENVRYAMYYSFVPPWYSSWPGYAVPQAIVESLADEELRAILGPSSYEGQTPDE